MQRIKVCHITSVHKRYDIRILKKECVSLANGNFDVTLLVNDENKNEELDEVKIVSTNYKSRNRFERIFKSQSLLKKLAIEVDADIYHFHDPELLPLAIYFKNKGKKIIFDFHEDVAEQIKCKIWIPRTIRNIVSYLYKIYEEKAVKKFNAIISVTPKFVERFKTINKNSVLITNYPVIRSESVKNNCTKNNSICFAGGITEQWNHTNIIRAIEQIDEVKYVLAGNVSSDYFAALKNLEGGDKIEFLGRIPHEDVVNIYFKAFAGMSILSHNTQVGDEGTLGNTKLFEFMEAGLPVICSNNRLWKEIIDKFECGIAVNPDSIEEIRAAISYLKDNPEIAMQMGQNGRRAIEELYNWSIQENELLRLYEQVISR